jgi:hypothetical protein
LALEIALQLALLRLFLSQWWHHILREIPASMLLVTVSFHTDRVVVETFVNLNFSGILKMLGTQNHRLIIHLKNIGSDEKK